MGRPVVAAQDCVAAINVSEGVELIAAGTADEYVAAIQKLLQQPKHSLAVGFAGRQCVRQRFSWEAHLAGIDRYLPGPNSGGDVSGLVTGA